MLLMPESIACMPEAQLRITVHPGTFWPQPMRSAATRPMFTSSTDGAAQPRITSSSWFGANGWRTSSVRPACVARSAAAKGPGRLRDLRNGVRAPRRYRQASCRPHHRRLLLQLLGELGAAEVLREIIDPDHLLAERFLACPLRVLVGRDDALVACRGREVHALDENHLALLQRLAQLGLDGLAGDAGDERLL